MARLMWVLLVLAAAFLLIVVCLVWYSIVFPRQPFRGSLPALTSEEAALVPRLERAFIAAGTRAPNAALYADLEAAARHIEATLMDLGYTPLRQEFTERSKAVRNIEVAIEPSEASG